MIVNVFVVIFLQLEFFQVIAINSRNINLNVIIVQIILLIVKVLYILTRFVFASDFLY